MPVRFGLRMEVPRRDEPQFAAVLVEHLDASEVGAHHRDGRVQDALKELLAPFRDQLGAQPLEQFSGFQFLGQPRFAFAERFLRALAGIDVDVHPDPLLDGLAPPARSSNARSHPTRACGIRR